MELIMWLNDFRGNGLRDCLTSIRHACLNCKVVDKRFHQERSCNKPTYMHFSRSAEQVQVRGEQLTSCGRIRERSR